VYTSYWLAVQIDNTTLITYAGMDTTGGTSAFLLSQTTLPSDWGTQYKASYIYAIYAVWEEAAAPAVPYTSINIGDTWKTISGTAVVKINIGDVWKNVSAMKINIGDSWKAVTLS